MIRISEEKKMILNCYPGTKEDVTGGLWVAIPFIEDQELKEMSGQLLEILAVISNIEFEVLRMTNLIDPVLAEGDVDVG